MRSDEGHYKHKQRTLHYITNKYRIVFNSNLSYVCSVRSKAKVVMALAALFTKVRPLVLGLHSG